LFERHGLGNRSGRILGETGAPGCGKHATVRNYLVRDALNFQHPPTPCQ
jgi:hypothetical protein